MSSLSNTTVNHLAAALPHPLALSEVKSRLEQVAGSAGAALTAQSTTITIADAAGTPEYTMASYTNSSAWGFAAEDEIITFTYVVRNLQVRVAELEARLQAHGLIS